MTEPSFITESSDDIDACVDCGTFTRFWVCDGVFPLCPSCTPKWTFDRARKFAVQHGFGPLSNFKEFEKAGQ